MQFSLSHANEILARTPAVMRSLLQELSDAWTTCNEGPDTWSAYDVVGHLIHGEKTDWVPRMRLILGQQAERRFEPFDRFAQFRDSQGKTLGQLLDEFERLRVKNLEIVKAAGITEEKLGLTGIHPAFGEVTLKQLLSTWVVHDLGHIAQVSRVMAKQYTEEAGPWKEYLPVLTR